MVDDLAPPFPWFGGKRRAAPIIWSALGDPGGYVEPFCGSAAVLLARPRFFGCRVETLNDADGWLVNAWRSIQLSPETIARHAIGPVTEIDYHARLAWLQERRTTDLISWLEGDPENHDPKAAAWWLYVCACGIGNPFDVGPWRVVDGRLIKAGKDAGQGINRRLPFLGNAGRGIHRQMVDLDGYMRALAVRLQRVRITSGDWRRCLKPSVLRTRTGGDGGIAVFLDPPYLTGGHVYAESKVGISDSVREWCLTEAAASYRMILCGYESEHDELLRHGWSKVDGKAGGGSGYSKDRFNGRRERLWLSPSCIGMEQPCLF